MANSRRGFTLIELLVVIAIIALLLSIIMPSLARAKEQARVVICLTNFKSIGLGMFLYADKYDGKLMSNEDKGHPYTAFKESIPGNHACKLGLLFTTKIIEEPKIFYCPSTPSRDKVHLYISYCSPGVWGTLPQYYNNPPTGNGNQWVRTGCSYYPQSRIKKLPPTTSTVTGAPITFADITETQTDLSPYRTMVTDVVWSWKGIAHRKKNIPRAINALFDDGHATTTIDGNHTGIFSPKTWFTNSIIDEDPDYPNAITMRPYKNSWDDERRGFHTILSMFQP